MLPYLRFVRFVFAAVLTGWIVAFAALLALHATGYAAGSPLDQAAPSAPDLGSIVDLLRQSLGGAWVLISSLVAIASIITGSSATPDPATRFGRLYRLIETLALVNDNTKDRGKPAA